jgi:hypothetical protein
MTMESKREYLDRQKMRYQNSSKREKEKILDNICDICEYNRKYAISILNSKQKEHLKANIKRKSKYDNEEVLKIIKKYLASSKSSMFKEIKTDNTDVVR